MNYFKLCVILTATSTLLGWEAHGPIDPSLNISPTTPDLQIQTVHIAKKNNPNLSNSKGTLKIGSAISIDPGEVTGISKAEAKQRFILNKIYRIQEGTSPQDLFILDEKATKWVVENVSDATMGRITHSVVLMVSGKGKVWALIQKF